MLDKSRYHAFGGTLVRRRESHGHDDRQKTSAGKKLSTLESLGNLTDFEPPLNTGFHPEPFYRVKSSETTRYFPL